MIFTRKEYFIAKKVLLALSLATIAFGIIQLMRYTIILRSYDATVISVDRVYPVGSLGGNYYEDLTVVYGDHNKASLSTPHGYKDQLPVVGDTMSVFVSPNGEVTSIDPAALIFVCFMQSLAVAGIFAARRKVPYYDVIQTDDHVVEYLFDGYRISPTTQNADKYVLRLYRRHRPICKWSKSVVLHGILYTYRGKAGLFRNHQGIRVCSKSILGFADENGNHIKCSSLGEDNILDYAPQIVQAFY